MKVVYECNLFNINKYICDISVNICFSLFYKEKTVNSVKKLDNIYGIIMTVGCMKLLYLVNKYKIMQTNQSKSIKCNTMNYLLY